MAIVLLLESVVLLFAGAWTVWRRRAPHRASPLLVIYALFSLLWAAAEIAVLLGNFEPTITDVVQRVLLYGAFLSSLLFLSLTRAALSRAGGGWIAWLAGLGWLAAVLATESGLLGTSGRPWTPGMLALGTIVAILTAGAQVVRAYRQAGPAVGRGRLAAWLLTIPVLLAGDVLLFIGYIEIGIAVHLIALPLAVRALSITGHADGPASLVRGLASLIASGLAFVAFGGLFWGVQAIRGTPPQWGSIVAGGLIALAIALLFRPLLDVMRHQVRRLLFRGKFDPTQVVQEVGMRVRDISGLNELSSALLSTVRRLWDAEQGAFFVVHPLAESDGAYWLERVDAHTPAGEADRALGADSPLAQYLETEIHPLTRDEIERAPQFVGMEADERNWFLAYEAYVPLHAHGEWVGLLGIGPKPSQGAYLEQDLWLLRRLAEGTGPVLWHLLRNRALVGDQAELKRAYLALEGRLDQLQNTYDSLETEHRRLAEQDAAKTRFLEAIDEPLRAPFVNLDFALQLMEHYGLEGWTRDQRDQLEQLRAEVHKAKQMVENLIALAGLLRGEEQLASEELDVGPLVQAALQPLRVQAEAKGVHLAVEVGAPLPLVYGDRRRLGDAIFQLAHQALQFTEAAGSIWVHCWGQDDTLHVEVQDTGRGMLAKGANGLWERQRVDRRSGRSGRSLNLELALVQSIVGAHGGRVYAKSEPKIGNTLGFQIPAQKG